MAGVMYDAATSPDLALCKRRGAIAMSHYMIRSYASSSPQPDAVRKLGMGAVLNPEGYAAELKGASRAKGRSFAEEALATVEKGVPRDGTVKLFYSVDTDLTDLSVCDQAFRGINDVHAGTGLQIGVYGEGGLIERLHGLGLVQGGQWLSMSEGFGGFTHALKSGLVAVVQMHDARGNWIGTDVPGTDRNTVINPYTLGAWWPAGSPYAGGDQVSQADVIAALKSPEGQQLLQQAVWSMRMADPTDPTGKRTYRAGQYLVTTYRNALSVPGLVDKVAATAVDATAVASAIRDRLVALVNGSPK